MTANTKQINNTVTRQPEHPRYRNQDVVPSVLLDQTAEAGLHYNQVCNDVYQQ